MTDHGNVFGAYDFYAKARAAGVKPIIGIEAYFTPNTSPLRPQAGALEQRRRRRRLRRRRLHPHDAAGRDHRGHAQPVPAVLARLDRGLLLQAARRPRAARRARHGPDRAPPAARRARCRPGCGIGDYDEGPRGGRRLPGHLRRGQLLPRADGPRPRRSRPGSATACCGWPRTSASRRSPPTTRTTPTPRTPTAHEHLLCVVLGQHDEPTRSGSSSTATATTSSRPPRCASCGASATACPRPATTPC